MPTDKEFEDFFRQQLGSLEEAPPPAAWHKIKADLRPWYRKYQWLAAAGFCGLLSVGVVTVQQLSGPGESLPNVENVAQQEVSRNTGKTAAPAIAGRKIRTAENAPVTTEIAVAAPNGNTQIPGAEGLEPVTGKPEPVAANNTFSGQKPTVSGLISKGTRTVVIGGLTSRPNLSQSGNLQPAVAGKPAKAAPISENQDAARSSANNAATGKTSAPDAVTNYTLAAANETGNPKTLTRSDNAAGNTHNGMVAAEKGMAGLESTTVISPATASTPLYTGNPEMALLPLRGVTPDTTKFALPAVLPLSDELIATVNDSAKNKPFIPQPVWAFSAFISPRVTFGRYAANRTDNLYLQQVDASREGTSDVMSVEGGIRLHRTVSPKLTVDGGLVITHLKDQFQYVLSAGEIENVQIKTQRGSSAAEVEVNYRYTIDQLNTAYTYTGMHFGATYTVKQTEENRFYVTGGGALQLLVSSKTEHFRNGQLMHVNRISDNSNPLNNLNTQINAGFGFAHKVDKRLAVLAEPVATYFLGSVLRQTEAFRLKPYTFGVNVGLRFDL